MREEPIPDYQPPLRAIIVGCGRMGAGREHTSPWLYTHIQAYQAFSDEVTVVGFVDRVLARAELAAKIWDVPEFGDDVIGMLKLHQPDLVSICTPPSDRLEIIEACQAVPSIKGIWCEKPYTLDWSPQHPDGTEIPVQVNYIRRFDRRHQQIADRRRTVRDDAKLIVVSALDIHTAPHFSDLARFWNIRAENLIYVPFHGPSLYILREPGEVPGRYAGWRDEAFINGGVETGFMEAALANLIEVVRGKTTTLIAADYVVRMGEEWARGMVEDGENVWHP